jgi:hypothetical protein
MRGRSRVDLGSRTTSPSSLAGLARSGRIATWRRSAGPLDDALTEVAHKRADEAYADRGPGEVQAPGGYRVDLGTLEPEIFAQFARDRTKERSDERLTLAALWDLTHGRLDLYHTIVTGQARRSFMSAQASMAIGFVLLVGGGGGGATSH